MIQKENIIYLKTHHPLLWEKLYQWEKERTENGEVQLEFSKKGQLTLRMNLDGNTRYILSKYDPEKEAQQLINRIQDIDKYNHVLFIGVGLGYHITEFVNKYPNMKFSIYEPNIEVLYKFLSHVKLNKWPTENIVTIFSATEKDDIRANVYYMQQAGGNNTYIYSLPSYVNLYNEQVKVVIENIKALLIDKKINLITKVNFQKRWAINSIKNFPYLLKTPNILNDLDKEIFNDRPVIIVAAGPSLSEEFENLKYIKEKRLAYIFSVGSAVNALIENDIYPDATFTYDPTEINQVVIQKIKEKNIKNIPLVFGSSVGFETLDGYPGLLLHMITSQDNVAPLYLDTSLNLDIVLDAPSIAVVTIQLVQLLGFGKIILVGQNLSYLNNRRYSEGIKYDFLQNEISKEEKKELILTKDVYGNDVETNQSFNIMRKQIELYIRMYPNIEVINTTKNGAHIEGTTFMDLSKVIGKKLSDPVMNPSWCMKKNTYDLNFVTERNRKIKIAQNSCEQLIEGALNELVEIDVSIQKNQLKQIEKKFEKFDKEFSKLKKNIFYQGFIEPLIRVHNETLSEESQIIRYEKDLSKKGVLVVQTFKKFLDEVKTNYQFVLPFYLELDIELTKINPKEEQVEK